MYAVAHKEKHTGYKKSGCKSSESVCTFEQKGSGILMIVSADAYFKNSLQTLIFKDAYYVE